MNLTPCKCALKCFDKVSQSQRQKLFDGFWKTANFDVQNAYLSGWIKVLEVKRRYTDSPSSSRRRHSRIYYMYVQNGTVLTLICKTAFLRIHSISNGHLCRALKGGYSLSRISRNWILFTASSQEHAIPSNKADTVQRLLWWSNRNINLVCLWMHIVAKASSTPSHRLIKNLWPVATPTSPTTVILEALRQPRDKLGRCMYRKNGTSLFVTAVGQMPFMWRKWSETTLCPLLA